MIKVAIFASGSGSNAENLVRYFKGHGIVKIEMLISDRSKAFVFDRMRQLEIPAYFMNRAEFENGRVLQFLKEAGIDRIILAGFLKLMPVDVIDEFRGRIINIHPALLPKYGGKGMYGKYVHEAIVREGEAQSGITIHYVDENFDEGEIIAQYTTAVSANDTAETVAAKIHDLEMQYFPAVVEKVFLEEEKRIEPG